MRVVPARRRGDDLRASVGLSLVKGEPALVGRDHATKLLDVGGVNARGLARADVDNPRILLKLHLAVDQQASVGREAGGVFVECVAQQRVYRSPVHL